MTQVLELCVLNRLEEVARSIEEVNEFLTTHGGIPSRVVYVVNLVLEEVLTNILKYAHHDGESHLIEICIELNEESVTMVCTDDGLPFDPLSVPLPDLTLPIVDREPGGLGIHLIRTTVDSVAYTRNEGKNVLTMSVKLEPETMTTG